MKIKTTQTHTQHTRHTTTTCIETMIKMKISYNCIHFVCCAAFRHENPDRARWRRAHNTVAIMPSDAAQCGLFHNNKYSTQ